MEMAGHLPTCPAFSGWPGILMVTDSVAASVAERWLKVKLAHTDWEARKINSTDL